MKGVLTRVEQKIDDWCGRQKSIIYMFVRGEDMKRYVFIDPFFEPYCYFRRGILNVGTFNREIRSHQVVNIEGASYLKVYTYLPNQVSKLRNIIESKNPKGVAIYEADVLFPLRYIIDKKIRGPVEWVAKNRPTPIDENVPSNLRILMVDIEMMLGFIKCITIYDSYEEKYHTFYWDDDPITETVEEDWVLHWELTEKDMLSSALAFMVKCDPDVVTGYNIDWDLVWVRKRAESNQLGKQWDALNPLGYPMPSPRARKKKFRDFWVSSQAQKIPGRNVIDLLEIIMKIESHQLSEFNLDYVATNYLKPSMGKLKWKGLPIGPNVARIWPQDRMAVLRYNKHDVRLCVELNKQLHLISFADEVRKFAGCQLDEIFSNKRIAHVETLRRSTKPVPINKREERAYKGAIVIEPKKGVYKWVIVMDFRSLYPSVILQLNIDPDTYIPKQARKNYNLGNAYILRDQDSNTEYWFKKSPEGDLPAILRNYLDKREEKRKLMRSLRKKGTPDALALAEVLDVQQIALKVIANAFYGSLLYRGIPSAWMCARAITCGAREAIRFAKATIENLGYKVIYGDTDSIMIESKFDSYQKCVEEAEYLSQRVTKEMPKFLLQLGSYKKNYIKLALDKLFSSFLIAEKKKRYAGIRGTKSGDGKLEVKGFGMVRSDTSQFAGKLQKTILREILRGRDREGVKRIIEEELKSFDKQQLTDVGVPCVLTKRPEEYKANSIQVKAFKFSNKYLGTDFGVGDKPKRFYVKMKEEVPLEVVDKVDVVAYEEDNLKLPDWLELDWYKQVEKTVKPKLEGVINFVNLDWKDIQLRIRFQKPKKKKKKKKKELEKGQTTLG